MSDQEVKGKSLKMRVIWFVQHNVKIHLVVEFSQLFLCFPVQLKDKP